MAALSDHAENLLLNFLMTTGTATRPTNWYLALYTAAPNDAGGGTECSGNGYSRQSVSWDAASGTGGTTSNSGPVTFTASGGNFGNVTHIGIHDASTSGNLLWHGAMAAAKQVNAGDSIQFATGSIDLTIA
tara:strand:- start:409 stop:801 length:393 start_codon:yes stop_codon:yes gene_type:complete